MFKCIRVFLCLLLRSLPSTLYKEKRGGQGARSRNTGSMHFIRILTLALQLISGQLPQMLEAACCHLAGEVSAATRCASKHLKEPEQNNQALSLNQHASLKNQ